MAMAHAPSRRRLRRRQRRRRQDRDRRLDAATSPTARNECGSGAARQQCAQRRRDRHHLRGARRRPPQPWRRSRRSRASRSRNADGATIKAGLPANATIALGARHRQLGPLADGRGRHGRGRRRAARHVEPALLRQPGQGLRRVDTPARRARRRRRAHQLGRPQPRATRCSWTAARYNGQTIAGIGLTKAAHIYFRAKSLPGPGDRLRRPRRRARAVLRRPDRRQPRTRSPTGAPRDRSSPQRTARRSRRRSTRSSSGRRRRSATSSRCLRQVHPPVCPPGKTPKKLFADNFDNGTASADRWIETHTGELRRTSRRATGSSSAICRTSRRAGLLRARLRRRHLRRGRRRERRAAPRQPGDHVARHGTGAARRLRPLGRDGSAVGTAATSRSASTAVRGS